MLHLNWPIKDELHKNNLKRNITLKDLSDQSQTNNFSSEVEVESTEIKGVAKSRKLSRNNTASKGIVEEAKVPDK